MHIQHWTWEPAQNAGLLPCPFLFVFSGVFPADYGVLPLKWLWDVLPNEATGFKQSRIWGMLYDFQKDAVLAIINKLEKYNGCILADSVGLGKTFTALAVIKYYENRNKTVLVLCPKKLSENWNTYKDNYVNNPIASDRLNYDVLFHTDLKRKRAGSEGC